MVFLLDYQYQAVRKVIKWLVRWNVGRQANMTYVMNYVRQV
jgi:hypothetical protein